MRDWCGNWCGIQLLTVLIRVLASDFGTCIKMVCAVFEKKTGFFCVWTRDVTECTKISKLSFMCV